MVQLQLPRSCQTRLQAPQVRRQGPPHQHLPQGHMSSHYLADIIHLIH